jgi:hypothetical protein
MEFGEARVSNHLEATCSAGQVQWKALVKKNLSADYTDYADSLKEVKASLHSEKANLRNLCNLRINSCVTLFD